MDYGHCLTKVFMYLVTCNVIVANLVAFVNKNFNERSTVTEIIQNALFCRCRKCFALCNRLIANLLKCRR